MNINLNDLLGNDYTKEIFKSTFCSVVAFKINHRDIDAIYNTDSNLFNSLYQKNKFKEASLSRTFEVETEIKEKKILGILENDLKNQNYDNIKKLFQKSNTKMFNNLKNKKQISVRDIFINCHNTTLDPFVAIGSIYFYNLTSNLVFDDNDFNLINAVLQEVYSIDNYKNTNFSKEVIKKNIEKINAIKSKLNLSNSDYSVETILDRLMLQDAYELKYLNDKNNIEKLKSSPIYRTLHREGKFSKIIGIWEGFFKYLEINTASLNDIVYTKNEINELILHMLQSITFNKIEEDDVVALFIPELYMSILSKLFRDCRNKYIYFRNEENQIVLDKMSKNMNKYKEQLDTVKFKNKELINTHNAKEKELLSYIKKLELENKRLNSKVEESEDLKQEVIKLRNITFQEQSELDDIALTDEIDITDELKHKKFAIIGGNQTWVKKLKDTFPEWIYVNIENTTNDLNYLANVDKIFININMKHSLYFKVKSIITKYNIPYEFLTNSSNIEFTLQDIYNKSLK